MIDPINMPGNWNNNSSFASIHTQSTRSGENLDCGSQGGSDDRFDQILVSPNVMNGTDSLRYLTNSYIAVGNDGSHFNTSLISAPTNTMYPDSVVRALYYMSDHLPVAMKVVATYPTSNGLALFPSYTATSCYGGTDGTATVTPNDGQAPYQYLWDNNAANQTTATAAGLGSGSYCVQVTDALGEVDDYCIYVPQPDSLSISVFKNPDDGSCSGQAFALVSGGNAPYTLEWNDPSNQTGTAAYNLCAGMYTLSVTDANGCISTYSFEITSNSNELVSNDLDQVSVYPNPFNTQLILDKTPSETSIVIANAQGKMLQSDFSNAERVEIDLSDLIVGTYFATLRSKGFQRTVRIVKTN